MKIERILNTTSICLIAAATVLLAITPPASGYEISIYSAYSSTFWFLLIGALVCAFTNIMYSVYKKIESNTWVFGIVVILAVNSIVLLLPLFRGYFFYGRTDPGQHYGFVKDIELTGHFGAAMSSFENFYPASHLFVATLSQISGLDSRIIALATPWLFWLLYVFSMMMLAKFVALNREQFILITAFSLPLSFIYLQSSFFPSVLIFFFAPLTLFLIYRSRNSNNKVGYAFLLILVLIILPFMHAGDTLSFLIIFICLGLVTSVYAWLKGTRENLEISNLLIVIAILTVTWIAWFVSFRMFGNAALRVFDWLRYGTGMSTALMQFSILNSAHADIFDAIEVLLNTHGHNLLYVAVAGAIIVSWWRKPINVTANYAAFACIFIIFLILSPVFYFIPAIGEYRRMLPYAIMGATFIIGFGISDWLKRIKFKLLAILVVISILCITGILGIFSVHYSPFIKQGNQQVSRHDISGMTWFLQHQNGKNLVDQQRVMQYSLSAIILGNQATPKNIRWGTNQEYQAPSHFGYDENDNWGQKYTTDRYYLNDVLTRTILPVLFPNFEPFWRWSYADWSKIENDPSVLRIYENSEFEVYYIRAWR